MNNTEQPAQDAPDVGFSAPDAACRAIVAQSDDAFLVLDGGSIVACNPGAERMFGLARQQLLASTLILRSPSMQADGRDSAAAMQENLARAAGGVAQRFRWDFLRADGDSFCAEVKLDSWADAEQQKLIATLHDISDLMRVQQEMSKKNIILQSLLDSFPGGVSMVDQSLQLVAWNGEMLRLLDFPESLFLDDPTLERILRFNVERGEYGDVDPEPHLRAMLERAKRFEPHVFERVRPDGTAIEVRGAAMANGGFVTTYLDITDRHQIKERLHHQSVLLEGVLQHLPQGVSVFDNNLELQLWNDGFIKMLNLSGDSIEKGCTFEQLLRSVAERGDFGECDIEKEVAWRIAVVRKFEEHCYEYTDVHKRTYLIQGKPLCYDGKLLELVTTYTDITERKQAEIAQYEINLQLAQLVKDLRDTRADLTLSAHLAALGELVAGVAHEVNTPMANSLLMAGALGEYTGKISAKLKVGSITRADLISFVERAEEASALIFRNLTTAGELLTNFKQVAVDQASSQRRRYNLRQVCCEIIASMKNKLAKSGHRIDLDIPDDIVMDGFPGPFEQVVANFINNALLHGFDGRSNGKMKLSASQPEQGRVLIEFSDDGDGIAEENRGRIYEQFFTTKLGQGGSGLGLNISHNIVTKLLGGQISMQSVLKQGTTFRLDLPLSAPDRQN